MLPVRAVISSTENAESITRIPKLLTPMSSTSSRLQVAHIVIAFHKIMRILKLGVSMDTELIFCG